jgi:phage terminase large subunit GpA-like protein
LWTLGVDDLKSTIYSRLAVKDPGPGYIHFPLADWCDDEYFAQLTAEKIQTKHRRGVPYREWVQTRKRNEALDCMVYGNAALILLNPNYTALARRLSVDPAASEPKETQGRTGRSKRTTGRGGFVNSWK